MKTNKTIKKIVCIIVILIVLLNTQSQIFAVDIIADKNELTKTTEKSEILEESVSGQTNRINAYGSMFLRALKRTAIFVPIIRI